MKKQITKYIIIILGIIFIGFIISTIILYQNNKSLKNDLSITKSNEKAFIIENSKLKEQSRVYQFTIDQLEYFNDSLLIKINEVRKELKIKDNDLKQLQYLFTESQKTDTIIFRDTIFKDSKVNIDTTFGDKWYQMNLKLKYPNTIISNPIFNSEKYIIVNYKNETINPPKKCWLSRLFQKKHKIVEVEVVEKNPYSNTKQQKFIEIIK